MLVHAERLLFLAGGAIIGLAMLWVGLRGLALRRPFVIRGVWFTGMIAVGVLSIITPALIDGLDSWAVFRSSSLFILAWPLLMLFVALLAVIRLQGLLGFGMKSDGFRDAVFEFTESLTTLELPQLHTRLEASVESWMGTAQLRASNLEGRRVLVSMARCMNRHFRATKVPLALLSCVSYTTFGGVLVSLVLFSVLAV